MPTRSGKCPFCPGSEEETLLEVLTYRENGSSYAPGWTTRVFPNRFPALRHDAAWADSTDGPYTNWNGVGAHEVIVDCPEHVASMADTTDENVTNVFLAFRERLEVLKADRRLQYALLFKNHGQAAGASLEHSHSQLIAVPMIPRRVQEELEGSKRHFDSTARCVYCDVLVHDEADGSRLIYADEHTVVLTAYASRTPFEIVILPRRHRSHFETVPSDEVRSFASVVRRIAGAIDKALDRPAYNFLLHDAPMRCGEIPHFHWHLEVLPRLALMAGFEWGTGIFVNPTTPEEAAAALRCFL